MLNFLKYWPFVRIIRLVLAIAILVQAIQLKQYYWLPLSAFLLYQVIANKGCRVEPKQSNNTKTLEETEYEEI